MTVRTRQANRIAWWHCAALLSVAVSVSGAYFRSCGGPTHGIYPQPCHPDGQNCQPTPAKQTEALLAEGESTSVLVLKQWDELEFCVPYPVPKYGAYVTATSPHESECHIDTDDDGAPEHYPTCYCYWNLDIPDLSVVGPWLREHVAPRETCDGGRSVLLQLGTVFPTASFPRTVPAYLKATPYDDPAMIEAFARFWNALSEVIAANLPDATRVEDGRLIVDPPEVIVSIGNEVDLYLDAPMGVDGTPEQAWERYAAFYAKAADWVRGRDVDLDGDGLLEANPSNLSFPRSVTFSSTWMTCSPGWRVAHLGSPCSPARPPIGSYLAMASSSDFWSFTRYVPFAGYDPEPEDVYATARAEVSEDLVGMGTVSVLGAWGGVTPVQRPLLIQEMGFPSSRVYPWDNALAEQQADYVAGAFDAWTEYNQRWTPLPEWWVNVRFPPSECLADGAASAGVQPGFRAS